MMKLKQESERLSHMKQLMEIQNELDAQRQERARAEWLRSQRLKVREGEKGRTGGRREGREGREERHVERRWGKRGEERGRDDVHG
eukprot:759589-Hanusia_phi.AAC.2